MYSRRQLIQASIVAGSALSPLRDETRIDAPMSAAIVGESVGVCVHLSYSRSLYVTRFDDVIAPRLEECGVRNIRDGVLTGPGSSRNHPYYGRCRQLVARGVKFSLVCADASSAVPPTQLDRLGDVQDWMDGGISILEGSNEPNYSKNPKWPLVTAASQRRLYEAVRSEPRLANVSVAGPSYWGPTGKRAGDLSRFMDYGNIHPYAGGRHPETRLEGSLDFYRKGSLPVSGGKPLIASEVGYHSALQSKDPHMGISGRMIARYLPRLVMFYILNDIRRFYIYELASTHGRGLADKESNFGLLTNDGVPTPGFFALKNVIRLFEDPGTTTPVPLEASILGKPDDLYQACFQRADGDYLLAIWLGRAGWNPQRQALIREATERVRLRLPSSTRVVEVNRFDDDGMCRTEWIGRSGPEVTLTVGDNLRVFRIRRRADQKAP